MSAGYSAEARLHNPQLSAETAVELSIRAGHHERGSAVEQAMGQTASISIATGSCRVHCYATKPQLQLLAAQLLHAAEAIKGDSLTVTYSGQVNAHDNARFAERAAAAARQR